MPELEAAPLIGYRRWLVSTARRIPAGSPPFPKYMLRTFSTFVERAWETAYCEAVCGYECIPDRAPYKGLARHEAPHEDCTCGVHGFYSREPSTGGHAAHVSGVILAWGRVIRHELGFRAQHAQIIAFTPTPGGYPNLDQVAEYYDVPVLDLAEATELALWQGMDGREGATT